MEAVGIDVVATAEAAGLSVELPAEDHPAWTGLLLIDDQRSQINVWGACATKPRLPHLPD